jgi:hypothetical protein
LGGGGGGWEGRRKEEAEAEERGLKKGLGGRRWEVGEEAVGSERNCIGIAVGSQPE